MKVPFVNASITRSQQLAGRSRKWATERNGCAVRDVMETGGWRNEETLLRSYQQPDAEMVRQVVLHPTHRIVSR